MTPNLFDQMREALRCPGAGDSVRIEMRDNTFYNEVHIQSLVDFAQRRCTLVAAGLDELNPLETLAIQLLCDSAWLMSGKAQSHDH